MKFALFSFAILLASLNCFSQSTQEINSITSDYRARIIQNGGSISSNDLAAVTTFIAAAKSHQYWDKLIDIGPLAGNDINAAMTKLKYPTGVSAQLENSGFVAADYTSDEGFQLNASKSFNTKTNLNALSLQGRFGFSMWLSNGGTAWMGSPNSTVPYSLMLVQPNHAIAYVGTPPSYAMSANGFNPPAMNGFYHVIKQTADSVKMFIDDNMVGKSGGLANTQLRNADVLVFKDAANTGKGAFYSIDDGTLTDAETKQFYLDVRQLMYGLRRKTPQEVADIANDYQERIIQNGGSINSNDLAAVTTFIAAAKSHQYWDKLIDIGPLAGSGINAALTKLKYPAKGYSSLVSTGYSALDYTPDEGFELNASKSFNTKTNLGALSLQGRFGFSMWLSDGSTAWMGSPNSTVPYSLMLVQPNHAIAYVGTPPSYAMSANGFNPPSTNGFYHVIKQTADSVKMFIDDNMVGKSGGLANTQLRNADVLVFKDATNTSKGSFYSIDDGTMTDAEAKQFYLDVRRLMYGLRRKTPQEVADIANDYQERIIQNGGSINSNDLAAVTTFIAAAKSHQYWDKLIDIGPLAGNDINAAMTKLKYPTGVSAQLENSGFVAADYTSDEGFQLNASKSFNTKTNLNALSLQGRFGFSMWLSNGGTAWMGSSNSIMPYSLLLVQPNHAIAYVGTPPSYAMSANSFIPPSANGFYHVIKQTADSVKMFIDDNMVSKSGGLANTQLRNADVLVFKDASNTGKGAFYSIDDGTLTDAEAKQFYLDVRQLIYGLVRKTAPPEISASGLYTQAQSVYIKQKNIDSSVRKVAIHYTTDGSTPTTNSPVYSSPLNITSTTHIQAITAQNGKTSKIADAWVAVVPEEYLTKKYYTAHVMVNLLAFTTDMDEWLRQMKASGYNLIWAHLDDYVGNYVTTLKSLMDAAVRVGGIQIMPGASWWVTPELVTQMFKDTWTHPALFKMSGKRIYTGWDYQPNNQRALDSLLLLNNISKNDYFLWAHSRYPYSFNEDNVWVGEYATPDGYLNWSGNSYAVSTQSVDHLYQTRSQLDGLINFAVDQGANNKSIIRTNRVLTQSSIQKGKLSMAGVSAFYASVSFADFGFNGAAEIWDSLLASPAGARPNAMSDITADDYAELSYMSPMVIPSTKGLSYIPPFSSGFNLGDNVRYPLTDHSGIQKFLRPWVNAFLNNQTAPVFSEDRMFAWYWLHPKDVSPTSTIPSVFAGYAHLNQQWWNNTVYATGNMNAGGGNQVWGMKNYLGASMDKIRMAAHLTAPARLKINNTVSDIMPAGAAYFEIEMGSFRGTPTFSIIRNNAEVKKGEGVQPITDNVFPGGWNFLSTEILPAAGTSNFIARQVSSTDSFITDASSPAIVSSITAYRQDAKVNVDWTIKTELTVDKYEIEKMSDNHDFAKVATMSVKADDALTNSYSWVDMAPKAGDNQYRVKIINKNGTAMYTRIVNATMMDTKEKFNVYPNPVTGANLTIQFDNVAKGVYKVELVAANGQKVAVRTINHPGGSVNQTIPIDATLARGIYSLQITGGSTYFSKQIFK